MVEAFYGYAQATKKCAAGTLFVHYGEKRQRFMRGMKLLTFVKAVFKCEAL